MELMELPVWRWEGRMVLPLSQDVQWDLLKLITTCKAYEPAFLPRGIYPTAIWIHVHQGHENGPHGTIQNSPKPGNNPNVYQQEDGYTNCGTFI